MASRNPMRTRSIWCKKPGWGEDILYHALYSVVLTNCIWATQITFSIYKIIKQVRLTLGAGQNLKVTSSETFIVARWKILPNDGNPIYISLLSHFVLKLFNDFKYQALLSFCLQVLRTTQGNITVPHCWKVTVGWGNVLVQSKVGLMRFWEK